MLRLKLRATLAGHQLDIFFWKVHESRVIGARSIPDPDSAIEIEVPEGTNTIAGHLLGPNGAIAQSFVLNAPYTFVGQATSALSIEHQIRTDIAAGENENREMKSFFNPDQNKDMRDRVLHSAIAFANTSGGRIYVGVEDDGRLSGNGKLLRITTNPSQKLEQAARELGARIRKVLVEETRPVFCPGF